LSKSYSRNREDNEYVISLGKRDGAQVGMVLNVYRDKEIAAEIGNFESTPKSHFVENINFFIFVNCCFC